MATVDLVITLADLGLDPLGSVERPVIVTAQYTHEVRMVDGTVIPAVQHVQRVGESGRAVFKVVPSDDPDVAPATAGFGVVVGYTTGPAHLSTGRWTYRTVVVTTAAAVGGVVMFGALSPAEPVPAPYVSVADVLAAAAGGGADPGPGGGGGPVVSTGTAPPGEDTPGVLYYQQD